MVGPAELLVPGGRVIARLHVRASIEERVKDDPPVLCAVPLAPVLRLRRVSMISSEGSAAGQATDPRAIDEHDRLRRADDDTIRALVIRLSRAHPSGGRVIER